MDADELFFHEYAGLSYNPATETAEEGRERNARRYARAEREARNAGVTFAWSIDPDIDSSDFDDDDEPWSLWQCAACNANGDIIASLHGIDFGRGGSPYSDPYARVVQAELAMDGAANEPQRTRFSRKVS